MSRCASCDKAAEEGEQFCGRCGTKRRTAPNAGATREVRPSKAGPLLSAPAAFPLLVRIAAGRNAANEKWLQPGAFVVGRTQGDWLFPGDALLSSRHATLEMSISSEGDGWAGTLSDQSKNGAFIRATGPVQIVDGLCCLIGNSLLHWTVGQPEPAKAAPAPAGATVELKRRRSTAAVRVSIVDPNGEERPLLDVVGAATIGGASAQISLNDPAVSEYHAEVTAKDGKLFLEDRESVNGVFVKTGKGKIPLHDKDEIRVGRQLFRFELRPL